MKPWKMPAKAPPPVHHCRWPLEACERCQAITDAQLRIARKSRDRRAMATPRSRTDYRRVAYWLELEAQRGYESSEKTAEYARNMRWAAELAELYGPGTWLELIRRAGAKNPYD